MITSKVMTGPVFQPAPVSPEREQWEREQQAFHQLLGGLLVTHRGQYVAIHDGRVVATGPDLVEVTLRAYSEQGRQPIYVDLVTDHPLPAVHMPHYRAPATTG